jgi:hypothetical protein
MISAGSFWDVVNSVVGAAVGGVVGAAVGVPGGSAVGVALGGDIAEGAMQGVESAYEIARQALTGGVGEATVNRAKFFADKVDDHAKLEVWTLDGFCAKYNFNIISEEARSFKKIMTDPNASKEKKEAAVKEFSAFIVQYKKDIEALEKLSNKSDAFNQEILAHKSWLKGLVALANDPKTSLENANGARFVELNLDEPGKPGAGSAPPASQGSPTRIAQSNPFAKLSKQTISEM